MNISSHITFRTGKPGAYQTIKPGMSFHLPDSEARDWIARGLASTMGSNETPADLIDAMLDAIDDLAPEAFGKDGRPAVKAIEEILGQNITAVDRDKAWALYQAQWKDE